jgi:serine/threonine-protein kinase RsbW
VALFKKTWKFFWLMHNAKPLNQSSLQVETDLEAVTEVLQWFEELTSSLLPQPIGSQCQLALVEGFTNAVRHAHHDLPQTTVIDLELKVFEQGLEMRIWDQGSPFDWQAKLQEALCRKDSDPLEQLQQEGGRGLIFIHQLMDEVSYVRLPDQRNCLLMRKQY